MKSIKKQLLSKTLGKHAYWTLNKELVKTIGLEATLILQHIIDLQAAFNKDEIFQSQSEMADELGISEYAVKNRVPELVKLGLVNVIRKGVPCKNYYSTNDDKILNILVNQLDDTKSTNKSVDYENELTDDTNSTFQLGGNQPTSEYEIDTTITKNTNQEVFNKNTNKNTGASDVVIADKILNKVFECVDDNKIPELKNLLVEINEDYGSFSNLIKVTTDDEDVIRKYNQYYTNTLQLII